MPGYFTATLDMTSQATPILPVGIYRQFEKTSENAGGLAFCLAQPIGGLLVLSTNTVSAYFFFFLLTHKK